jgi:hypothetical protein
VAYDPHVDRCREADVIVTKQVVGTPPPGTTFRAKVDCEGEQDDAALTFGSAGGTKRFERESSTPLECEVTETESGGATSVDIACDADENAECNDHHSFTLFDDDSGDHHGKVHITVTNTFPVAPVVLAPTFTG